MESGQLNYSEIKRGKLVRGIEFFTEYGESVYYFRIGDITTITAEDKPHRDFLIGGEAVTVKRGSGMVGSYTWRRFNMEGYKFHFSELFEMSTQEKITYYLCMFYYRIIEAAKKLFRKLVGIK